MKYLSILISLFVGITLSIAEAVGQDKSFPQDPQEAQFETSDIQNFWKAFDQIEK